MPVTLYDVNRMIIIQVNKYLNRLSMKKIFRSFPLISLAVLPAGTLFVCPLQHQNGNNYTREVGTNANQHNVDRTIKNPSPGKADLDVQMKDLLYQSR